jgi:transposase
VIVSVETGKQAQVSIAATFRVSLSTVEKWLRRKRETGQESALLQVHGPTRTLQDCAQFIRAEIKQQPDSTLAELCERVATVKGMQASPSMMCRQLQHLGLRRKKVAA